MIFCNLKGGLGNMLFQIAASKNLAIRKNTECSFPNLFEHLAYLSLETKNNPKVNYAFDYLKFLNLNNTKPDTPINKYEYPFEYTTYVPEESNFYIDGYFQSEKYFLSNKREILDFIKPNDEIENLLNTKYNYIFKENTVSLHVRRGDYLKLSEFHPVQRQEYYNSALKAVPSAELVVVFSDDIEWCKNNLVLNKKTVYIENEKDYIELFLMSRCRNNIIANSSFSWWGAWLNQTEIKKVVAPKNWFGNQLKHLTTNDIYAKNWIIL